MTEAPVPQPETTPAQNAAIDIAVSKVFNESLGASSEPTLATHHSGGFHRRLTAGFLAVSAFIAGCTGNRPPSTPNSLPTRTPDATMTMPQSQSPDSSVTIATQSHDASQSIATASPSAEITKPPLPFDVQKLVADISSGDANNEYPAVTAATLKTEFTKLSTTPDIVNIPTINSNWPNCITTNRMQVAACPEVVARLVVLANKTNNPDEIKLARDSIGFSLRLDIFNTPEGRAQLSTNLNTLIKKYS